MAFTENERMNAINALLEEQEKVDSLIGSAKSQVTRMRRKFADDVDHLSDIKKSPSKTIALFWKGEVMSRFNDQTSAKIKSCLEKTSASNVNIVSIEGWATATDLQIEQDLWTLWIDQISPGGRSPDKRILLNCFDTLERRKSSLLCLMMWLFPEIKERWDAVESIVAQMDCFTCPVRDRMLFWIACMRDKSCGQEKMRAMSARILDLKLSSGSFAAEKSKSNGELCSSAIELLALISLARENGSDNNVIGKVRQVARCIVEQIPATNDEGGAWAYYALCEYIDLERR